MSDLCILEEEPGLTKAELRERLHHDSGRCWGADTDVVWSAIDRFEDEAVIERDAKDTGNEPPAFAITDAGK